MTIKYALLTESHCTLKITGFIPHQSSILFWFHSHLQGNSIIRNVYLQHKLLKFYSEYHFVFYTSRQAESCFLTAQVCLLGFFFFFFNLFYPLPFCQQTCSWYFLHVYTHMNKGKGIQTCSGKKKKMKKKSNQTCQSNATSLYLFLHLG